MPDRYVVASRLLRSRHEHGWPLRELAAASGVGTATVHRAERGRAADFYNVAAIAKALGLSLDWLVSEPACAACDSHPPAGFTCNECGTRSA